ncbi:MAG: 6-carboxytetrahydropterin synthase QueD [Desulfotomaculales bacterium]
MYELTVRRRFSAAHRLKNYTGRCGRLHGHTWLVEVSVAGETLGESGLLIDFHDLQQMVDNVVKDLDHQFLNELDPFCGPGREANPTAENIARHIYHRLKQALGAELSLVQVKVGESPDAWAVYREK